MALKTTTLSPNGLENFNLISELVSKVPNKNIKPKRKIPEYMFYIFVPTIVNAIFCVSVFSILPESHNAQQVHAYNNDELNEVYT